MTENTPATTYKSQLAKANDVFMPMIVDQLQGNGIVMSDYQRMVTLNAMTAISTVLNDNSLSIKDVDSSNVTEILLKVASLELNASADPHEVYFIVRNKKDKSGVKHPTVEMNIEGDGNDALLSRFGRNVKNVFPYWVVREEDKFEYPKHQGIKMTPPSWDETGRGKVVRVVYPIEFVNGEVNYYIGEREDVKRNLLAHVANNLMWDSGNTKKNFMEKAENMTLDEILNNDDLVKLGKISPAWSSPQARESMILRKMRNNVVKKIPKDFRSSFIAMEYNNATDDSYESMRRDVTEEANQTDFDEVTNVKEIEHEPEVTTEEPDEVNQPDMPETSGPAEEPEPGVTPESQPTNEVEDDPF